MTFRFSDTNQNVLRITWISNKEKWSEIVVPPGTNRTDIMHFGKGSSGYELNSSAIVIISNKKNRYVYHKGSLVAHVNLK